MTRVRRERTDPRRVQLVELHEIREVDGGHRGHVTDVDITQENIHVYQDAADGGYREESCP